MSLPNDFPKNGQIISCDDHARLMQLAFDQICDKSDWKAPIDCVVPWSAANIYMDAIKFMTATEVKTDRCADAVGNPSFRLRSVGYRAGPAGG